MQLRNVSDDERMIVYGVPFARVVVPDGVVDVDDAAADAYTCQPAVWRRVDASPAPAPVPPAESVDVLRAKVEADQAALAAADQALAAAEPAAQPAAG